jgi:hypothetical protein
MFEWLRLGWVVLSLFRCNTAIPMWGALSLALLTSSTNWFLHSDPIKRFIKLV